MIVALGTCNLTFILIVQFFTDLLIMEVSTLKKVCEVFYLNNFEKLVKAEMITRFREFGVSKSSVHRYYDKLVNGENLIPGEKKADLRSS